MIEWLNSTLGIVVIGVVIVLLTVRTVLDALVALNLAPPRLRRWLTASRREELRALIKELGLEEQIERARSTAQVLSIRREFHENDDKLRQRLDRIVARHIDEGDYSIGSTTKRGVKYFVNVREAFCNPPLDEEFDRVLAEIMIDFIANKMQSDGISFDMVVARRNGLDILGYLVAKSMRKPLLLYSDHDGGVWLRSNGEAEQKMLDYHPDRVRRAIIVDDSCVGGSEFREMAATLRRDSVQVKHVFVLFCRAEVDAAAKLGKDWLTLHALDAYDDERLGKLLEAS